jgi:hypothetical protein
MTAERDIVPWDQDEHAPGYMDGYTWVENGHTHYDTKAIHTLYGRMIENMYVRENLKAIIGAVLLAHIEARGESYLYAWINGASDAHFLIKEVFVE